MKKILLLAIALLQFAIAFAQNNSGWDWASTSGTSTNSPGKAVVDMTTDATGNVYTTGYFVGTLTIGAQSVSTIGDGTVNYNTDQDAFIAKYDANGNILWLKKFGIAALGSNQRAQTIKVDLGGNVYVGGSGMSLSTVNSAFLNKYDSNGNLLWSKTNFPLYEIGGIALAADGNLIVMESNQNAKNIYKINSSNGNELWTVNNIGVGSNGASTYKDFTDAQGNIYYTAFGTGNASVAGQTFSTTAVTSYIVSLKDDGTTRWVQKIDNIQVQLGFTVDDNGKSYIQFSGGFGSTFQGISTASPLGNRYFELDQAGNVFRSMFASPYPGLFRVKSDGIYTSQKLQFTNAGSLTSKYGDYYFRTNSASPTKAYAVVIKYNKTTDQPIWANSMELTGLANNSGAVNSMEISANNKVLLGGYVYAGIKINNTNYTSTIGGGINQTDFFVAQFDPSQIALPATTTWTGNANNSSWTDANNWTNGAPTGNERTILPTGISTYPTGITTANATGRLEIATGVNVALPMDYVAPGGIDNLGNVTITGTGAFVGFSSKASPLTGNGKIIFNTTSPSGMANFDFPGDLEVNIPGTNVSALGITVGGNLNIVAGKLGIDVLTMTNPNATINSSANGFVYHGTLKRKINANGSYIFPVSAGSNYAPLNLSLHNLVGPAYISVYYDFLQSNSGGTEPNITLDAANQINTVLNKNFWKISADATITSGTFDINLQATTYTNGVTDAARFVTIRRAYRAAVWGYEGTNGTSTQTGETVASGVTSNGIINTYTTGLNAFGEFGIGIATAAVANGTATETTIWNGAAGDKVWATAANWSNGIPNGLKDAIIPSGMITYPEIFATTTNAKSLTIENGATVKLPLFLNITGNITNNGSILLNGNTADYFTGFRAGYGASPSVLKGNGKLVFTDVSPKGINLDTILLVNDLEINRTIAFKLKHKTSGNVTILNGAVGGTNLDGVEADLNMVNPDATLTVNAPTSYIIPRITRAVKSSGTYNFPIASWTGQNMLMNVKTNNVVGATAYKVDLTSNMLNPKLIVDGFPVNQFLSLGNQIGWTLTPIGTATSGSLDLNFEARGYSNGVSDVNRYVFLTRANTTDTWVKVNNAVITENAGVISVELHGVSAIFNYAEFAVGIKGAAVTWNGNVSNVYNDAANWTPNTIPNSLNKVIFNAGATNYPTSYNASAMVEIGAGTTLSLPTNIDFGSGIVNNGTIVLANTGIFNGFNNGNSPLSGTGTLVFNNAGPYGISLPQIGNGIEINRSANLAISQNLTVTGNVKMTTGLLTGIYTLTMSNPNASLTTSPTSYIATNFFSRYVNSSGSYQFPIGTSTRFAPATLTLNAIIGPTKITSSFVTTSTGNVQVNTTVGGKPVNRILDAGTWTLTPDVALTGGNYDVALEGRAYTNGSANANNYVVLKRLNAGYNYQFFGNNSISTEVGSIVTAKATGITSFSDFSIGVLLNYETKWTGANGDKKWTTPGNWDNGVPTSVQKAVFDNSGTNFPEIFTGMNYTVDKVEVGTGVNIKLPVDLNPTNGIINNGTIQPIGSYFSGFYVSGILPTGTGKLLFTNAGPATVAINTANVLNQNIEIDRSTGLSFNAKINGNLNLVNGVVTTSNGITLIDPNAILNYASGAYISGNLTRAINSSGTYNFPVGNATTNTPVILNLNAISGPSTITVGLLNLAANPQPNVVVGGKTIINYLNTGIWFVAANTALAGGSYGISIATNQYTNGVPEADRYALIKQSTYGTNWVHEGVDGVATQVGGTDNSGVISNGLVNVSLTGLNTMTTASYYAIGIFEPTTLPVKLINFSAKAEGNAALLSWQTASELNNEMFILERSIDGTSFHKVGEVKGNGTVNQLTNYSFRDYNPANGNNYYRLKQLDFDGKFDYSEVKVVRFALSSTQVIVYPNPTSHSFAIKGNEQEIKSIKLINALGQKVLDRSNPTGETDISNLTNGIYFLTVKYADGQASQHKLIKK